LEWPCSHIVPARVEIPHSWRLVRYTRPISWKILRGWVVIALKQVFANQYSCSAESKSLVIKRCSAVKVNFEVVKFVWILFVYVQPPTHNAWNKAI
jgi:hypothetical protein